MTTPSSPAGISSESFFTSSPARPKIACSSFSSGVSSLLDFGAILPTRISPGPDARADADDAGLIEIGQSPLADVRNVARELFAAQLGLANFDVVFLDVNRGERVFLHQLLADDDGVFEVVAVVGHERDEHVAAQGQFALMHARRRRPGSGPS